MKASLRAKRMQRNHKRMSKQSKLNLVSLMDIFTILVFFLMVNSGDVEVLQADKTIALPKSVAEQKPDATLLLKINADDLVIQGQSIASVEKILSKNTVVIEPLDKALQALIAKAPEPSQIEQERGRAVTIMADKDTPYELLKRVISTCSQANYRDISLAVNSAPVNQKKLLEEGITEQAESTDSQQVSAS